MKRLLYTLYLIVIALTISAQQVKYEFKSTSPYLNQWSGQVNPVRSNPYNPTPSNSGRSGPKRVPVYDHNGNEYDTPGGASDSKDWDYKFDGINWWCDKHDGNGWQQWRSLWGWGFIWYDWRSDQTGGGYKTAEDMSTNPTPIGDVPILFLIVGTVLYLVYKNKRSSYKN